MPQIASPQAQAPSHAKAHAWRSAHQGDPASSSPFASLLDDTDASTPAAQHEQQQASATQPATAGQGAQPDDTRTDAANDTGKGAAPTQGAADATHTAVIPIVAAAAAAAAAADASTTVTTTATPTADGSTPGSKPNGSPDKTDKKDVQTVDAAADALALAAGQPPAANTPPAPATPAAVVIAAQATQQAATAPAATIVAAAIAAGGQPATPAQTVKGASIPGAGRAAAGKPDASQDSGKSDAAATADADTAKPDGALTAVDATKTQATPAKVDTPANDGTSALSNDPAQQTPAQPDANAPAAAPANATATAIPAATADKLAAAAGKPAQAPRHDIDATSVPTAGSNALTAPGGDATATSQASASAATAASGTASSNAATGTTAIPASPAAPVPVAVPISGLAVEIAGKAHAGKNDFAIRLDPPELGRIEVKLSVDKQGQITSHVIADRSDTLDLLRRDASGLERSLQDAGLKMSGNGLQFSLRDQSSSGQQNTGGGANGSQIIVQDNGSVDIPRGYSAYSSRVGGLDIRV